MIGAVWLVLAVAASAAPARRRSATVVYATQRRLYLDAGQSDGLVAGQVLALRRGGRSSGTCTVESVAANGATCLGAGAAGDTFEVTPPSPVPAPPVARPPPPEPSAVVERENAAVTSSGFDKVDFHGTYDPGPGTRAEAVIAHSTWAADGAGPWHQERADLALRDAKLGAGLTFDLDLSARRWSLRSDPVSFRPEDPTQLYVWEAAVSRQPRDGGLAFSVGRVRPRSVPGQVILDGAQAGWRAGESTEAGIFGGTVPDDVTLAPSLQHGTFGAYWAGQHVGSGDSLLRMFRHEARVAFVNTSALGRRVEGEALVQVWLGKHVDASANVRVGAGDHTAPGSIDAARFDGNAQVCDSLSLTGGFRYEGMSIPELDGPANLRFGGAARHADLSAQWDPAAHLRISVLSGLSTDVLSQQTRRWIGPELALPGLLAGISAGYLEEQGWSKGRSSYLQVSGGGTRLQVLTRFSWFHTISGLGPPTDDLALSASLRAQLTQLLSLRLSAAGRSSLNGTRSFLGAPATQSGWLDGALAAQF